MAKHREHIMDQFSRNADLFATVPVLTSEETLQLLVRLSGATPEDVALDVACGAGVVACAFAATVKHATGLDLVPAMIDRARALAAEKQLANVSWREGEAVPLPFADESFSIVTSRYAFHHFENPRGVLTEMKRVCQHGGRILVADMQASEEPMKAAALNRMERLRDPSHARAMPLTELQSLFRSLDLAPAEPVFHRLEFEVETLLQGSHPLPGDDAKVRRLFENSLEDDGMALQVRREAGRIQFSYPIAVLVARRP